MGYWHSDPLHLSRHAKPQLLLSALVRGSWAACSQTNLRPNVDLRSNVDKALPLYGLRHGNELAAG
jgi:hypothetical protein